MQMEIQMHQAEEANESRRKHPLFKVPTCTNLATQRQSFQLNGRRPVLSWVKFAKHVAVATTQRLCFCVTDAMPHTTDIAWSHL